MLDYGTTSRLSLSTQYSTKSTQNASDLMRTCPSCRAPWLNQSTAATNFYAQIQAAPLRFVLEQSPSPAPQVAALLQSVRQHARLTAAANRPPSLVVLLSASNLQLASSSSCSIRAPPKLPLKGPDFLCRFHTSPPAAATGTPTNLLRRRRSPFQSPNIKYAFLDDNDTNGLTPDLMAPWDPYFLEPPAVSNLDESTQIKLVTQWANKKAVMLSKYGATATMFPDITPKGINQNCYSTMIDLLPILKKDCPRRFRSFFEQYGGWLIWRKMIVPEALNYMISQNALKCTKVVLEGKAPELQGIRCNPNWMNQYGNFPLHQAADRLDIDMIKLLIANGASANVRTADDAVIGGLLPLHVAVENTSMHKYLEDNLLPNREDPVYSKSDVYKLIYILCLPEMKIFLNATRELAKHTNDLGDVIWNYIKAGKLVQAGILLLAAQEHVRLGPSCKKNGSSKPDGFAIIVRRITNNFYTLDLNICLYEKEHEQPDANVKFLLSALLLVNAISQAGGALHEYIQVHSKVSQFQVPHVDVLERVSSILKDFDLCPPEDIDIGNLVPYKAKHYEEFFDNPNFLNQYGQFPLHRAAESFSAHMIKFLIKKGASANVRMAGDAVIQGLLPLHVAVENTCLHKYLEKNLLPNREHPNYSKADIYNLILLLCLPEMKIFLDTTRELANHTNDLVGEVWNYIKAASLNAYLESYLTNMSIWSQSRKLQRYLSAAGGKVEPKKARSRRWELGFQKELFFPYWRSVLSPVSPIRVFPSHAIGDALSMTVEQLHGSKSTSKKSVPVTYGNFHLSTRLRTQFNHQPRRSLSTAAALLKVLRSA